MSQLSLSQDTFLSFLGIVFVLLGYCFGTLGCTRYNIQCIMWQSPWTIIFLILWIPVLKKVFLWYLYSFFNTECLKQRKSIVKIVNCLIILKTFNLLYYLLFSQLGCQCAIFAHSGKMWCSKVPLLTQITRHESQGSPPTLQ